jgi:hypothetical protein
MFPSVSMAQAISIATRGRVHPAKTMFPSRTLGYSLIIATTVGLTSVAYANGLLPDVTIRPGFKVEVHQDGVGTVTTSPNPLSGPPRIVGQTGSKDLNNLVKNIDGANHLPQEAAAAAGDAVMKAAEDEANKLIDRLKQKLWAQFEELKKQAMPYIYLAGAALVLILMMPGFIGALFAIWVVRSMDRRRARKQERQLKKALAIVKGHADEIHTKLAA